VEHKLTAAFDSEGKLKLPGARAQLEDCIDEECEIEATA